MHRPSEDPARADGNGSLMPTPLQGGCAVLVLVALAIAVGTFDSDSDAAAETAVATRTAHRAGAGSDAQDLAGTTSAPIANPFSTFMQGSARDAASATPASEQRPLPFVFAGTRVDGGQTVVVLSQQGRSIAVHDTGMLNDGYEVEVFDERQIVLLHHPSMTRQVLTIGPTRSLVPAVLTPSEPDAEN